MKKYLFMILVTSIFLSCATTISGQLRVQDRELLIHPDLPGLGYPYKKTVCVPRKGLGKVLGSKCHQEQVIDTYDFNDVQVRRDLINAGFSCTSKMRFKY